MKWTKTKIIVLTCLVSMISSCNQNENEETTNDRTNDDVIVQNTNDTIKPYRDDDTWIISNDSVWKLRIYHKVGHIVLREVVGFGPITNEPMQSICVEVQKIDTSVSIDEQLSPRFPMHLTAETPSYRTMFISDNNYSVHSALEFLTERDLRHSVVFAFSIDALENFEGGVQIKLGYSGGSSRPAPLQEHDFFDIKNIHELVMPLDTALYNVNAPLADYNWFKKNHLDEFLPKKIN